jgi:polyisoprenoid-binding protein YceI
MHRYNLGAVVIAALLLGTVALAAPDEEVFDADDHCVAYRTIKDMFFSVDTEIVGRSCEVTASLATGEDGAEPRIIVTVPAKSFKSGNVMRNSAVADLLGAKTQPDLLFTSSAIDVDSLRGDVDRGRFVVSGVLTLGGRDYPMDFPLELVEHGGRHYVQGSLETTFEAFEVEVPTIAFGLVARPHEGLELLVHLELERVAGLEAWAASEGLL